MAPSDKGAAVDWIEELFGISPDGGSGALELTFAVAIATLLAVGLWLKRRSIRRGAPR